MFTAVQIGKNRPVGRASLVLGLFLASSAATCFGQATAPAVPATMPAGWEQLSAQEFADAARTMFAANPGPAAAHARAVIEHGWASYLNNEQFVAQANASTLRQMFSLFNFRRGQRVDADTTAEQVATDMTTFQTRAAARVTSDSAFTNSSSYQDLIDNHAFMDQANMPSPKRFEPIATFVAAHDWRSLTLMQQSWLYWHLNMPDKVNPDSFSVRWTGSIAAPTTDRYTFSQLRQYYIDGALKVWINNQLVLDSTAAVTRTQGEGAPEVQEPAARDDNRFQSQPIQLTAGQPVAFRAELVFDHVKLRRHEIKSQRQFPMAILQWEAATTPKQIIATEAYAPPAGFGQAGAQGVRGEYFSDTGLSQSVGAFLDPGLQWTWRNGAVVSVFREAQDMILAHCRNQLIQETSLAAIPADQRRNFTWDIMIRFIRGMTVPDRTVFIDRLSQHPELLKEMGTYQMDILFGHTFMLPGNPHLKLLTAWSPQHEPAPTRIAPYPGRVPDGYRFVNYSTYFDMADWLGDIRDGDAEVLLAQNLVKPDGSCNLAIAYILAQAAQANFEIAFDAGVAPRFTISQLIVKLDEKLKDPAVTGDNKASWLLARAYAAEMATRDKPRAYLGVPYLEEAELIAETPDMRFRVKQELVARLISLNRTEAAEPIVAAAAAAFTAPAQQTAIAEWRTKLETMPALIARQLNESSAAQARAAKSAHVAELNRRKTAANERGDSVAVERFGREIEAINAVQTQ